MGIKIFLASSAELKDDRQAFELLINRRNKLWQAQGVFLELLVWEDFVDAMSRSRLQDEYNLAIRGCDVFVLLFFSKVGAYTAEEFEVAFQQFQATKRPRIYTYFKQGPAPDSQTANDAASVLTFQQKLAALGHYYTRYPNVEGLQLHFLQQLDKLAAEGYVEIKPQARQTDAAAGTWFQASLTGDGASAQGPGAIALGAGAVLVQGGNSGSIHTGTQTTVHTGGGAYVRGPVNTGGGAFIGRDQLNAGASPTDLAALFKPLLEAIATHAPPAARQPAAAAVEQLKAEVAKGDRADDGTIARLLDDLAGLVPAAAKAIAGTFATPVLAGLAGPVTQWVLDKLKRLA